MVCKKGCGQSCWCWKKGFNYSMILVLVLLATENLKSWNQLSEDKTKKVDSYKEFTEEVHQVILEADTGPTMNFLSGINLLFTLPHWRRLSGCPKKSPLGKVRDENWHLPHIHRWIHCHAIQTALRLFVHMSTMPKLSKKHSRGLSGLSK